MIGGSIMKKKWIIAAMIVVICIVLALVISPWNSEPDPPAETYTIDIDISQVSYVELSFFSLGTMTIKIEDEPAFVEALVDMLNGEYVLADLWEKPNTDGGGPYSVFIYDIDGNRVGYSTISPHIYIYYQDGIGSVEDDSYYGYTYYGNIYARYEHSEYTLDMEAFYRLAYEYYFGSEISGTIADVPLGEDG